ncbi:GTPase ObgE [Desulfoluna butyratoxydans]|uniref:GTPase Obg n=1 Tax=Desulfoluna butyratoxydans TaxID=231438 RepID=A0A4U8YPI0_9BACT|nr:GTPase ObgE [Desulfoluna butyratoxydans]VFQ43582.1 gtp1/obg [Desulfoluna butyratoxydans]
MKFIDEATITVQSGNGGRGCVSFRREKFIEFGGPDGGDGGDGGDVVLEATINTRTLYEFRHKRLIKADNGGYGMGANRHGKNGKDIVVYLPAGTVVSNAETGEIIHDFVNPGERFVIAKGGQGGRGNKRFTTSRNRAPRFAQTGEEGEVLTIHLELKLLADVGIVGFPNAGKSTLIRVISSARPKTADYPFTTLTPSIGMVQHEWGEPFAVADIPGLIEGAHEGVGLGTTFLKHIERTRMLVHLIDASAIDPDNPLAQYDAINRELFLFSDTLKEREQLVVLNKLDITGAEENADAFEKALGDTPVLRISAASTQGVDTLKAKLNQAVNGTERDE